MEPKADGNSEKDNNTVYVQIAVKYEQTPLEFEFLMYNEITWKYMPGYRGKTM